MHTPLCALRNSLDQLRYDITHALTPSLRLLKMFEFNHIETIHEHHVELEQTSAIKRQSFLYMNVAKKSTIFNMIE